MKNQTTGLYRIADLCVKMTSIGRTAIQSEPYRLPAEQAQVCQPDFEISPDVGVYFQTKFPNTPAETCEYMATGWAFYRALVHYHGMLLHASAVCVDGKAYLFTAPSGTGKSTHTALWRKLLGERAVMLNDDKPAIRILDGTAYAYGTPWSGKSDLNRNLRAELAGICVLEQAKQNEMARLSVGEALPLLLTQTVYSKEAAVTELFLQNLDILLRKVPVWRLRCLPDLAAAELSYRTMTENANRENAKKIDGDF